MQDKTITLSIDLEYKYQVNKLKKGLKTIRQRIKMEVDDKCYNDCNPTHCTCGAQVMLTINPEIKEKVLEVLDEWCTGGNYSAIEL